MIAMNLDKIFDRMLRRTIVLTRCIFRETSEKYYAINSANEVLARMNQDYVIKFTESYFRRVTGFDGLIEWQIETCGEGRDGESELGSSIIRIPRLRHVDLEFVDTLLHELFHKTQPEWCYQDNEEEFLRDCIIEGDAPNLVSKLKDLNISISDLIYYGSWSEFEAFRFAYDHTERCVDELLKEELQ